MPGHDVHGIFVDVGVAGKNEVLVAIGVKVDVRVEVNCDTGDVVACGVRSTPEIFDAAVWPRL